MKTTNIHLIILYLLLGGLAIYVMFPFGSTERHVFISTAKLYNDFEMKQQLEKKLQAIRFSRKAVLDSLMLELKIMNGKTKTNGKDDTLNSRFREMKNDYIEKQSFFEEDEKRISAEYDQQIWNQLNQYVKEYSIAKHFKVVLGADGSGSLMYADEKLDITEEVVKYANEKYKGNLK